MAVGCGSAPDPSVPLDRLVYRHSTQELVSAGLLKPVPPEQFQHVLTAVPWCSVDKARLLRIDFTTPGKLLWQSLPREGPPPAPIEAPVEARPGCLLVAADPTRLTCAENFTQLFTAADGRRFARFSLGGTRFHAPCP